MRKVKSYLRPELSLVFVDNSFQVALFGYDGKGVTNNYRPSIKVLTGRTALGLLTNFTCLGSQLRYCKEHGRGFDSRCALGLFSLPFDSLDMSGVLLNRSLKEMQPH